tara:strand:- start:50 stop:769 length:720 start_codon:yes stop_codon:yes gene_type:complete
MKDLFLENFLYIPLPIVWLFIFYFFVKSNLLKKFILYFSFIILIITSLPITSTLLKKFFFCNDHKASVLKEEAAYILIPTAGIGPDGFGKWHPSRESIRRVQFGKFLSDKYSLPMILAGGGNNDIKEADLLAQYFGYDFYFLETESKNTYQMATQLKSQLDLIDQPVLLATTPIHHLRTFLVLKKQNIDVIIPDEYVMNINFQRKVSYSILPSINGYIEFNNVIYESLGIIWYYLTNKI